MSCHIRHWEARTLQSILIACVICTPFSQKWSKKMDDLVTETAICSSRVLHSGCRLNSELHLSVTGINGRIFARQYSSGIVYYCITYLGTSPSTQLRQDPLYLDLRPVHPSWDLHESRSFLSWQVGADQRCTGGAITARERVGALTGAAGFPSGGGFVGLRNRPFADPKAGP
ncbi:hypothetical protein EDB92DRAFT_538855 [Lactarius akahatsu]|uniref:Uncharacterized protein n=1 Tax=Lactarius akahatsu TaxID=416441 RepID=A0AAD4Q8L3_9AGAM|nr:hypothetical protein EDB92DRAFT_538855 [Lactarius akahatsu]